MASRSVGLSEMFGWVPATFRLIGKDPGAFVGAGIATLVATLLFGLPIIGYMLWQVRGAGAAALAAGTLGTTFWVAYAVTILASLALLPPLKTGWFRLSRAVDARQPARALDVFAPYRDLAAWGRGIVLLLLVALVSILAVGILLALFWSSIQALAVQVAAQQAATLAGTPIAPEAPPVGFFVGYLCLMLVFGVIQFAYMVAFAQVSLRSAAPVAALRDGFIGVGRNALKLFVFAVCVGLAAGAVMLVVMVVVMLLVAALSMLGTAGMVVGMLVLYVPFVVLLYALMYAGSYVAWKSLLGDDTAALPPDAPLDVLPA